MGIQINQLCNMNMKFAALLLFVSVTSATWCWEAEDAATCPGEREHGEATTECCKQVGGLEGQAEDRGCWVVGDTRIKFLTCCTSFPWACSWIED